MWCYKQFSVYPFVYKKDFLNFLFVCVYTSMQTRGSRKGSAELESQMVMSCLTWVLGTELQLSPRVSDILNHLSRPKINYTQALGASGSTCVKHKYHTSPWISDSSQKGSFFSIPVLSVCYFAQAMLFKKTALCIPERGHWYLLDRKILTKFSNGNTTTRDMKC